MKNLELKPIAELMGVKFHSLTETEACKAILARWRANLGGTVVTANLDFLRRCQKDSNFKAFVNQADLVVADGMPLIWASKLQGTPIAARIAGSTLSVNLCEHLAKNGVSVFLLGGNPGVADSAGELLRKRFPGLIVAGTFCPRFGFEKSGEDVAQIELALVKAQPDIVYVALGSPKQEQLVQKLQHLLPRAHWIGVGVSFSFITGEFRRAPPWVQRLGMEWFHRLLQEPRRLAKRYLIEGIPFACQLFLSALLTRFRRS